MTNLNWINVRKERRPHVAEVVFLTAQEAYDRTVENLEIRLRKNREELKGLIDRAISNGEFKVIYDRPLHSTVVEWLRSNYGYEVTQKELNDAEKQIWIVSWENAR